MIEHVGLLDSWTDADRFENCYKHRRFQFVCHDQVSCWVPIQLINRLQTYVYSSISSTSVIGGACRCKCVPDIVDSDRALPTSAHLTRELHRTSRQFFLFISFFHFLLLILQSFWSTRYNSLETDLFSTSSWYRVTTGNRTFLKRVVWQGVRERWPTRH